MRKLAIAVAAVSVALVSTSADLAACGDKYSRLGHSARLATYVAINRASILIYKAPKPNQKAEDDFVAALRRAGHTPVVVPRGTLSRVIDCEYDLVIALYTDAAAIKNQLRALTEAPDVLPVLHKPTDKVAAQATKEYLAIIREDEMDMVDVLETIDDAMKARLKNLKSLSDRNESGLRK